MNKSERHTLIIDDLGRKPALRVNEMARRYRVSSETIRRDLSELTERGLINRTYGGAVRIITSEPALSEREHIHVGERQRIAEQAASLVERDDVLMIGGGTTTRLFAQSLARYKEPLTIVTPSISVAIALGSCTNITIHMLPGEFNGSEWMVQGADTVNALLQLYANKAFLGASGLTGEGPSDATIPAGQIYRAMAERSRHTFVLADSSKFEQAALAQYAPWGPSVSLITDAEPPTSLRTLLAGAGSDIVLAHPDGAA